MSSSSSDEERQIVNNVKTYSVAYFDYDKYIGPVSDLWWKRDDLTDKIIEPRTHVHMPKQQLRTQLKKHTPPEPIWQEFEAEIIKAGLGKITQYCKLPTKWQMNYPLLSSPKPREVR